MRVPLAVLLAAGFAALFAANPTSPAEEFPGPVSAVVERVVDGDTLDVRADIWLGQSLNVRVRIAGVDAPELAPAARRNAAGRSPRAIIWCAVWAAPRCGSRRWFTTNMAAACARR